MKIKSIILAAFITSFGFFSLAASSAGQIVNEVSPGSAFEKLGVKAGDRIISYDGKVVTSVNDSMEMYNKLNKNSVRTIVIERDGKKQTLKYQLR